MELYKRVTHTYALGWSHEDEWALIGTVKILKPTGRRHRVVAPAKLGHINLSRYISQTMTHTSCRHEHDCCGCPTYDVKVQRVARRQYVATIDVSYNI